MAEFASKGVAGTGLGLGIAGTALGLLNGGLGGLGLGNPATRGFAAGVATDEILNGGLGHGYSGHCSHNTVVNRYELELEKEILEKDSIIAKLESERYTDNKVQAAIDRFDIKIDKLDNKFEYKTDKMAEKTHYQFDCVEKQIANQNVVNATMASTLACQAQTIAMLQGLTKTVIPVDSICPEVMPRYNSWTAPTAEAQAAAASLLKK